MGKFRAPGKGWLQVYAANGNTAGEGAPPAGETDQYYGNEAALKDGPGSPGHNAAGLNGELDREAERHDDDLTTDQVRDRLGGSVALLDSALADFRRLGYPSGDIVFCDHQLNSMHVPGTSNDKDPFGIVVVFPFLKGKDKNGRNVSSRVRARFSESIGMFVTQPLSVLRDLEQEEVGDGFCSRLMAGSHNADTIAKNAENCKTSEGTAENITTLGSRPA